jgi:hypothetical protein
MSDRELPPSWFMAVVLALLLGVCLGLGLYAWFIWQP